MTNQIALLKRALDAGEGIFRLFPTWVPRAFCVPGKRLKLHPSDYYALGARRGGIDERWFASTTRADNGPETLSDEGLSWVFFQDGAKPEKVLLKDAIDLLGDSLLGRHVMEKHGGWTMYSKFFDNLEPLPHHLHQGDEAAAKVGRKGKPEGYYFPPQLNNHPGYFPYTFFGLNPGTSRADVRRCLENWDKGDNGILSLSRAYKLVPGTGWDVPPGVLHAPGSLLTYEPQRSSDVFAMFQSLTWDRYIPWDLLVKDVPEKQKKDLDYILGMIDWDLNTDPDFARNRFLAPKPVRATGQMREEGYELNRVVYNSDSFSAKELTVFPGRTFTLKEKEAFGLIVVQGRGRFGPLDVSAPALIRFGQMTDDELFVTVEAARAGISIGNPSATENLVALLHFGPEA